MQGPDQVHRVFGPGRAAASDSAFLEIVSTGQRGRWAIRHPQHPGQVLMRTAWGWTYAPPPSPTNPEFSLSNFGWDEAHRVASELLGASARGAAAPGV